MNRVQLVGQLVNPVEVRRDRVTGLATAKSIIAVSRDTGTDFVRVTLLDRDAIDAERYLGDGSTVAIVARLHCALMAERDGQGAGRPRQVVYGWSWARSRSWWSPCWDRRSCTGSRPRCPLSAAGSSEGQR